MVQLLLFVLTLLGSLLVSASADAGCKCVEKIKPVDDAAMIFFGKAKSTKPRGAQDRVEFEIATTFKGDDEGEKEVITVYTNRFVHDCGIRFEVDKNYLVYGKDFYPRGVATSMCWGTRQLDEVPAEPEDFWKKVDLTIPEESEFEEKLREIAKPLVKKCGEKFRVTDAGFSVILSSDGDPVRPKSEEVAREKVADFRNCLADTLMQEDTLPRPPQSVDVQIWYQAEIKSLSVLLDVLPCGEACEDWVTRVKTPMFDTDGPDTKDKISQNIQTEWGECLAGGIAAVGPESHGSDTAKRRRDRMLADCAAFRSEFDLATPYIERVENPMIAAALEWGAKKEKIEGAKTVYPIGGETPTFPELALKGKPTPGKSRSLRAAFVADERWAMSPLYLEAFAESILADTSATPTMRDFASLAYLRAGKLAPEAAAGYEKLAKRASDRPEAQALRAEFDKMWTATFAPPVEEKPVVEDPIQEVAVEEAPAQQQDPMLLVIAGVLIVVAMAGIATILKRRS